MSHIQWFDMRFWLVVSKFSARRKTQNVLHPAGETLGQLELKRHDRWIGPKCDYSINILVLAVQHKNPVARRGKCSVKRWMVTIAVIYLTSILWSRKPLRLGSKSSVSSFVVSKAVEKGSFSIATAVPTVIASSTKQEMISAGWMSSSLFIWCCVFSGSK